jgi:hypothetical protein
MYVPDATRTKRARGIQLPLRPPCSPECVEGRFPEPRLVGRVWTLGLEADLVGTRFLVPVNHEPGPGKDRSRQGGEEQGPT